MTAHTGTGSNKRNQFDLAWQPGSYRGGPVNSARAR